MNPERTIGETIRGAREKRGVTQEGLSQGTRISLSVIRKLERDRFEELPGGLYTRNFIRNIADYLELDAELLLSRLGGRDPVAASGAADAVGSRQEKEGMDVWREESVTITRISSPRRRWWLWIPALLIAFAAAALLLRPGWFGLGSGSGGSDPPPGVEESGGARPEQPVEQPARAAEAPVKRVESPQIEVNSFGGPLALAGIAAVADEVVTAPSLLLEIQALDDCRVSLSIDGERHAGHRFPKRGGRWTLQGEEFFLLTATDAGRLKLRLNGEEYPLPGLGREPLVALRIAPSDH